MRFQFCWLVGAFHGNVLLNLRRYWIAGHYRAPGITRGQAREYKTLRPTSSTICLSTKFSVFFEYIPKLPREAEKAAMGFQIDRSFLLGSRAPRASGSLLFPRFGRRKDLGGEASRRIPAPEIRQPPRFPLKAMLRTPRSGKRR